MTKILVVPDVHGRTFWQESKNLIDEVDKVVFLGDYLDPYSHEGITSQQAIDQFKEIIQFKKDNYHKIILLLGNHDCAYCYDFGSASRYDYENEEEIKSLFKENMNLFRLWYLSMDDCLFSHAGITNDWLKNSLKCNIKEFLGISDDDLVPHLWEVSFMRGGWSNTGSLIWSDVRESDREETFYQIFGHTQLQFKPFITDKYACLDVRSCFIIDSSTKKIESCENRNIYKD